MRHTLAALCLSLGLAACGGTLDSAEEQAPQPAQQEQQIVIPPLPLLPYCWNLEGTDCSPAGKTQNCTDGIWTDYVCTCKAYGTTRIWDCPEVR